MRIVTKEMLETTYVEVQAYAKGDVFTAMFTCDPKEADSNFEGRTYYAGTKLGEAIVQLEDDTILERAYFMPNPIKDFGYDLLRKVGTLDQFWSSIKLGDVEDFNQIDNHDILGYTPLVSFSSFIRADIEERRKQYASSENPSERFFARHMYF